MTNAPGPPGMPPPPPVTDVLLTDELKEIINGAYGEGFPFILAYVDADGQPSLSFRGSTNTYSDTQIGVWVRSLEGGLAKALEANNRVTLFMRNANNRSFVQIRGRGRFENSEAARKAVYEGSPEREQQADPERKGQPLIVDIDRAEGMTPTGRFRMQKS